MVQVGLDFDLPEDLLLGVGFFEVGLVHDFEGDDEVEFSLSCDVHGSVFTSSKTFPNNKIILGPLPCLPHPIDNVVLVGHNDLLILAFCCVHLRVDLLYI